MYAHFRDAVVWDGVKTFQIAVRRIVKKYGWTQRVLFSVCSKKKAMKKFEQELKDQNRTGKCPRL